MLATVEMTTRNHLPAICSLMLRSIMRRFAFSYFSYSSSSLPKSLTSSWPLTDMVSFKMPLMSSDAAWASRVRVQRVLPARLVGIVKRGMMMTPIVARIQLRLYMATTAMMSVVALERMLVIVFVMTERTPSMSEVMRVMMSPWLLVVKKRWDISCRCRYIVFRMSNVMCWAIHVFM